MLHYLGIAMLVVLQGVMWSVDDGNFFKIQVALQQCCCYCSGVLVASGIVL